MTTEEKERLTMRVQPEFKEEIMRAAERDGLSANEFLKMAVRFYLDSRALENNAMLPKSIAAAIDGRLGMLEDRIAGLLFTNSVTVDELAETFALVYKINEGVSLEGRDQGDQVETHQRHFQIRDAERLRTEV